MNKAKYPYNLILDILEMPESECEKITDDMIDGLNHVLQLINESYRKFVVLRYRDKLTYRVIAEKTGRSVNTVSDRLLRGMRALRYPEHMGFIRDGLYFSTTYKLELKELDLKLDRLRSTGEDIPLDQLYEISIRTYNSLSAGGFKTLRQVEAFIEENGRDWYRQVDGLSVVSTVEVETALRFYRGN